MKFIAAILCFVLLASVLAGGSKTGGGGGKNNNNNKPSGPHGPHGPNGPHGPHGPIHNPLGPGPHGPIHNPLGPNKPDGPIKHFDIHNWIKGPKPIDTKPKKDDKPHQPIKTKEPHTPNPTGFTTPQLQKIMPGANPKQVAQMTPYLNKAMNEFGINTPARQNAFLAQVAHESGSFKYSTELSSGKQYEGRKDLGNTQPGDGERFKGRGLIQITGRANYAEASKALHLDLVHHPELASKPENSARIAGWFWNSRGLNKLADQNTQSSFSQITQRINGGQNGAADRNSYWQRAQANN